ncbi:hypothetical protein KAU33_14730 [Candidatus Dependentiae bacterium]|nr:hypothetical protein [Candidatus Dependentiae bacterium]
MVNEIPSDAKATPTLKESQSQLDKKTASNLKTAQNQTVSPPTQSAAGTTLVSFDGTKDTSVYSYQNVPTNVLAQKLEIFFNGKKYKLEEGTIEKGVYGIGNPILRIILGAFIKRYKFNFSITESSGKTTLEFSKGMTGAMGGVIGYSQMNNEFQRLTEEIKILI